MKKLMLILSGIAVLLVIIATVWVGLSGGESGNSNSNATNNLNLNSGTTNVSLMNRVITNVADRGVINLWENNSQFSQSA